MLKDMETIVRLCKSRG